MSTVGGTQAVPGAKGWPTWVKACWGCVLMVCGCRGCDTAEIPVLFRGGNSSFGEMALRGCADQHSSCTTGKRLGGQTANWKPSLKVRDVFVGKHLHEKAERLGTMASAGVHWADRQRTSGAQGRSPCKRVWSAGCQTLGPGPKSQRRLGAAGVSSGQFETSCLPIVQRPFLSIGIFSKSYEESGPALHFAGDWFSKAAPAWPTVPLLRPNRRKHSFVLTYLSL